MATDTVELVHQNTIKQNEAILIRLSARGKINNKRLEEWNNIFYQLNSDCSQRTGGSLIRQTAVKYGPIPGFPSGSWWGIRMDCSRDQVHSSLDKDIALGPFGVVSICTPHTNAFNDIDLGTSLTYTGSEYLTTQSHDPLIQNYKNNIPLRLIRSYNRDNKFAPPTGYRYDGMYIIIGTWISQTDSKKYFKYALTRLSCQGPPPWFQPSRASKRLSSGVKNMPSSCGSFRCHMYGCRSPEPIKRKKIVDQSSDKNAKRIISQCTRVKRHISRNDRPLRHVISKGDSPVQLPSSMPGCSPKLPSCKLQNTNISIRTELYDSTPMCQQNVKRSTPMTFCRMYPKSQTSAAKHIFSNSESKDRLTAKDCEIGANNLKSFLNSSKILNDCSRRSSTSSLSSTESLLKKLHLPEAVVAIEAMSPEQMLNLIVKKRHNPTGKLLIDSIIGLRPNDISLSTDDELQTNSTSDKLPHQEQLSPEPAPTAEPREKSNPAKNKNFSRTESKSATIIKVRNENNNRRHLKSMCLKRSTVAKALAGLDDSSLNRNKKAVQPFSKSTVPRKRRSELANLAIDANFVTNIQPRMSGRQLRCSKIILNKRKDYSGFVTNYTRYDRAKTSKLLPATKTKMLSKTRHVKNKNSEKIKSLPKSTPKGMKGKSLPASPEKPTKPSKSKKPKRCRMNDVAVQCSFQRDASTSVDAGIQTSDSFRNMRDSASDNDIDQLIYDSDSDSVQEIVYKSNETQTSGSGVGQSNWGRKSTNDVQSPLLCRSAFVPVNILDGAVRISRLRSIGFKAIEHTPTADEPRPRCNDSRASSSTVTKRGVDEQYNKYTSEENDTVGYLDDELHFEDLEEEVGAAKKLSALINANKYPKMRSKILGNKMTTAAVQVRRKRKCNESN